MSSEQPFFSVAMPAFNAADSISRAIESVLAQEFSNWELVVVDDGSTDSTAQVVQEFVDRDARIKLVRQENAGCGAARNTGVLASSGPFIVRLDADDALLPEYMSHMRDFIRRCPGYDIYSCNGYHLHADGSRRLARPGERYAVEQSFSAADMLEACHIFTIAVFTRDLFDRVGGISPDIYCEDLDFWLRSLVYEGAKHRYLPEPLALYTVSDTQMTADVCKILDSREQAYRRLLSSGRLSEELEQSAKRAIDRNRADRRIYRMRHGLRTGVERMAGRRAGDAVSRLIHRWGQVVRPVVLKTLSRRSRRDEHS